MLIPIPSQKKRFRLLLTIRAFEAVSVGIVVYDPSYAYTDYFRRKINFTEERLAQKDGNKRVITVDFPVSAELLYLEVYNKLSGGDDGFELSVAFAPCRTTEVWASPAQHRFMDFAIGFAQRAGHIATGFYPSVGHEFLIQYLPTIRDEQENELVTPARIHRHMPRVQLSQKLFRQYSIPVRVAILAHESCHFFLNTRSEKTADLCGINYYLSYGFPKIEAVYAATQVFNQHPESVGQAHVQRAKDIMAFIDGF